jgi:hypothetical protein
MVCISPTRELALQVRVRVRVRVSVPMLCLEHSLLGPQQARARGEP